MAKVPDRALPTPEGTNAPEETKEVVLPPAPVVETTEPVVEEPTPVGTKTPDNLLYLSLKEERDRRKEQERENKELKDKLSQYETVGYVPYTAPEPVASEIGSALQSMEAKLLNIEKREVMREIMDDFPQIKDKQQEFEEFLQEEDNRGITIARAAKLFLLENNLLATPKPARKGLESPTGGSREPQSTGMTIADLKRLRETSPRKFAKLLQEGKIKMADIKE